MEIPFFKAHGAGNDFLLSWREEVPATDLAEEARAICRRHTGIGADGWIVIAREQQTDCDASIVLYNADGSVPELSGNGTRCAAALLLESSLANSVDVRIRTGAGIKHLRLLRRAGHHFEFEMNMGVPKAEDLNFALPWAEAAIINVGNPQCVFLVEEFPQNWREIGAEVESHPRFPNRTNVSFVKRIDEHKIDVLFWERGVGETNSSGTGSTGAAAAAVLRGLVKSPIHVHTAAGPLQFRWDGAAYLSGPAEILGHGVFFSN